MLGYIKKLYQQLSRITNIYFLFFKSSVSTAAEKDCECQVSCLGQGSQYPEPGGVKFCPAQLSSLSTHLYVLKMVYKLAGGREVVEFQLILLTNKSPTTKPESGGTVSSQYQLSGKVHIRLLPTGCSTYQTNQCLQFKIHKDPYLLIF